MKIAKAPLQDTKVSALPFGQDIRRGVPPLRRTLGTRLGLAETIWNMATVRHGAKLDLRVACLFGRSSLLYLPAIIVLVRGAWVGVGGEIIRIDVALVELGRDGGWPNVLQ